MSINLKKYQDQLLFIPLGGTNEIGINVNLYHMHGKWIMVDCGSGFPDEYLPGVNMVVADISFIEAHKKDLLGIVLTHAHEDHLGAIQYLWNSLQCPIYTTKFTKLFLQSKISEYSFANQVQINEITSKERFTLGPFSIEAINLTHSAPEMQALMIRTDKGNILHTGDWKFDKDPVVGEVSNENALKLCGDDGVLALVCDSTNVFNQGHSGSEGDVRKNLVEIIASSKNMVVITTFASNLARIDSIIHAGQAAGRKVAITGRSLHRMFSVAQESGYLCDATSLIDEKSVSKYKKSEVLVISTGCQGEPMAAMSKIMNNNHPSIKLSSKDTIIFSSKIIPGNEKKIFKMFNHFVKKGIEVITEKDHFVHVSGHPYVNELEKMYQLARPHICIPVHGEPVHIHEHAKLARLNNIPHAIEVENGSVVLLEKDNARIIDRVGNGYLAVDGNCLLPAESSIFKMRRRMREAGILLTHITLNNKQKLLAKPSLFCPGLLDEIEDQDLIQSIIQEIIDTLTTQYKQGNSAPSNDDIIHVTKSLLKRVIRSEINKSPIIIVNITNT